MKPEWRRTGVWCLTWMGSFWRMIRMFKIGTICVKIAGRDAGLTCVVIDTLESPYVLIDGQTRRRKCNVSHLEPVGKVIKITPNADSSTVTQALETEGIKSIKKGESRKATDRPKRMKIRKSTQVVPDKQEQPKKTKTPKTSTPKVDAKSSSKDSEPKVSKQTASS